MAACLAGDLPTLMSLLSSFRNPQGDQDATIFRLLAEATNMRHKALVEYLLEQTENTDYPEDLIWSAIVAGYDIYMLYLVKNPAIWKYEWYGLGNVVCMALTQNNVEILTYLLETIGADPGRSLESSRKGDMFLPLEWAAYSSTESNAQLLLKHGAIINGTNALQLAAGYGRLGMVRLLVEAGADVNAMLDSNDMFHGNQDGSQGTALHYAAQRGAKDVVEYLISKGADTRKLDRSGYTARGRANIKGHDEIVRLIRSHET